MTSSLLEFQSKFDIHTLKIYESKYWIWSLRPGQTTIGSGILSLKREEKKISSLTIEEFKDLKVITSFIESSLEKVFEYDAINYLMLMLVDKQVHYHVIPRYKNSKEFNGVTWKDEQWPKPPNLNTNPESMEVLLNICKLIKQ